MGHHSTKAQQQSHSASHANAASVAPAEGAAIAPLVARRLTALLSDHGLTTDKLARVSGIDVTVLDHILSGNTEPTVDLLWKIANAIGVRISALLSPGLPQDFALLRAAETRRFTSTDGGFQSRVLSPLSANTPVEFYGITLAPNAQHHFDAHAPRTAENLAVHSGAVEIIIGREPPRRLDSGDSIYFLADVPHSYRNLTDKPAHIYLVMTYSGLPAD